tara:strand:- start:1324 stop:2295 length:972 start_codon:yes stop_codon:yes gene_type:complete
MRNLVCIIAGEPNSINSELIGKIWKKKKLFNKSKVFVVGNYKLIKKQFERINISIKIKKISNIEKEDFKNLSILDVPLYFNDPFNVANKDKRNYLIKSFNLAVNLSKNKKILGFINCPINKLDTFGNKTIGVTEFLAKKEKVLGKEAMLIYNKDLSVSPITTHIQVKKISKSLNKKLIINKLVTIDKFYKKYFNVKPNIGLLGLNPHNYELRNNSEEKKIIIPAIKRARKLKIRVIGPLSGDTAFNNFKKEKLNILVGMYHDQVLSPFKTIFKFNAINITLGLPYIRISPDHGTGQDIMKKNKANPESLIESIKFFNKINVKT